MASYIPAVNIRIVETVNPNIWYVYYRDHDYFTSPGEKSKEKTHEWVESYAEALSKASRWKAFFTEAGRNVIIQDVLR